MDVVRGISHTHPYTVNGVLSHYSNENQCFSLFEDDTDSHFDHNESRSAAFQYHFMPTAETSGFSNSEGAVPLTAAQAQALELENVTKPFYMFYRDYVLL